jgi:hypothetical protein
VLAAGSSSLSLFKMLPLKDEAEAVGLGPLGTVLGEEEVEGGDIRLGELLKVGEFGMEPSIADEGS